MDEELERIYTIPLRDIKKSPRNGRADRAMRSIRQYLQRHMKAEEVWIDAAVNHKIWERGKFKIPSKIRVRARLFDDGVCEVLLPDEDYRSGTSMREEIADERDRDMEEAHKPESEAIEKAAAAGAATPSGVSKPSAPAEKPDAAPSPAKVEAKPASSEGKSAAPAKPKKEGSKASDAVAAAAPAEKPASKDPAKTASPVMKTEAPAEAKTEDAKPSDAVASKPAPPKRGDKDGEE